jgi:hypothetical protein
MVIVKKINASTTIEAIVSVAIISSMMLIIFPFFGQVLSSNHRMEVIRGLHLLNEEKQKEGYNPITSPNEQFQGDGISIRKTTKQVCEIPELFQITTEFVNQKNKVIYSFSELKYRP